MLCDCVIHSFKFCSDCWPAVIIFTGSADSCQITAVLTQQCPLWSDSLVLFIDYYFLKIMLAHELDYIAHLPQIKGGNKEERGSTLGKKWCWPLVAMCWHCNLLCGPELLSSPNTWATRICRIDTWMNGFLYGPDASLGAGSLLGMGTRPL